MIVRSIVLRTQGLNQFFLLLGRVIHKETNVLPIGNQEEYGRQVNRHYRQLKTRQALIGEELNSGDFPILIGKGGKMRRLWTGLKMSDLVLQ